MLPTSGPVVTAWGRESQLHPVQATLRVTKANQEEEACRSRSLPDIPMDPKPDKPPKASTTSHSRRLPSLSTPLAHQDPLPTWFGTIFPTLTATHSSTVVSRLPALIVQSTSSVPRVCNTAKPLITRPTMTTRLAAHMKVSIWSWNCARMRLVSWLVVDQDRVEVQAEVHPRRNKRAQSLPQRLHPPQIPPRRNNRNQNRNHRHLHQQVTTAHQWRG